MSERRPERVAHLVQAKLAELLIRHVKDPRLQSVAVTSVRMTPDLRTAHVFFRVLGEAEANPEVQRALARAGPFLRGQIGRALGLRVTPELRFAYDTLPDSARRVEDLLRQTESAAAPGDGEDEE